MAQVYGVTPDVTTLAKIVAVLLAIVGVIAILAFV